MRVFSKISLFLCFLLLLTCSHPKKNAEFKADGMEDYQANLAGADNVASSCTRPSLVMRSAELPADLVDTLQAALALNSAFKDDVLNCLKGDKSLRELVDKQHPLPKGYAPSDLVTLTDGQYQVSRAGMTLRRAAVDSLNEMAAAARRDGITLVVSSAYRSYDYQEGVYNRIVREMGQESADRESARPGHSQHQTGLAADFGSIDDSFALTAQGRWMAANAGRFGWSLSFPDGYESVTGYRWESWHFRYVGRDLAALIDRYFNGIQQYALRFLYEYEQATATPF
jgi:D-alanyl-D-alanine carboxypeptidase